MTKPERLVCKNPWTLTGDQELCVKYRCAATTFDLVPRARDIAAAIANVSEVWFEDFLLELLERSPNRFLSIVSAVATIDSSGCSSARGSGQTALSLAEPPAAAARAPETRDTQYADPAHCARCGGGPCLGEMPGGNCAACHVSSIDPEYERLLGLRQTIDRHIGWESDDEEETGNYVGQFRKSSR